MQEWNDSMNNRTQVTIKNSAIILAINIVNILVNFISRKIFLEYIGLEFLGISGVFANVLTLLSLSDLGINTAITYQLFKPVSENNVPKIKQLVRLFDRYYRNIAFGIIGIGLIFSLIVPLLIKDSGSSLAILRMFFILQLATSVSSYLFASRKTLLFAHHKQYMVVINDAIMNFVFTILRIVIMLVYQDYTLFLVIGLLQIIVSNTIIALYSRRYFSYLKDKSIVATEDKVEVLQDMKQMSIGSIAGFIYSSTDNLIISAFLGVQNVGLLMNYKLIPAILIDITGNVFKPVQAAIGNLVNEKDSTLVQLDTYHIYTFIRFVIANYFFIAIVLLTNPFIGIWFGEQYVLSNVTTLLIALDMYLYLMQGPANEFIISKGLFKHEKLILIIGALTNLTLSLILVRYLGLNGVLYGTVISQLFYFIGRHRLVFNRVFNQSFLPYFKKALLYFGVTFGECIALFWLVNQTLQIQNLFILVLSGFGLTILINTIVFLLFYQQHELQYLIKVGLNIIRQKK